MLHKLREPIAFMTQAFTAVVVPLIFGSIYFQIDLSQKASLDRLSAISILVLMIAFFAFVCIYICLIQLHCMQMKMNCAIINVYMHALLFVRTF